MKVAHMQGINSEQYLEPKFLKVTDNIDCLLKFVDFQPKVTC